MAIDQSLGGDTEEMAAAQIAKKPQVEYDGYTRTITDVIRIRQEKKDDPAGVSSLMEGLDQAIKDCRSLRKRLEGIHKKRRTGYYHRIQQTPDPQTAG